MKKQLLTNILIFIFSISLFSVNGQDEIKPIDDFRGIAWGTMKKDAKFKDGTEPVWSPVTETATISIYTATNDDNNIGSVELEDVFYYFHNEAGLYKVIIKGLGSQNDEMDAMLKRRLGSDFRNVYNSTNAHMIWEMDDMIVDYMEHFSKDFQLTIESNAIAEAKAKMNRNIEDF